MRSIILKNNNLTLKTFSRDDSQKLYKLINKNRNYLSKWLLWVREISSEKDMINTLNEWINRRKGGVGMNFGIWYDGKLVGYISYANIEIEKKCARLAYFIDQDFQGKGIITKSCEVLIQYGFDNLNLDDIEIRVADGNNKSMAIPKRLKFTEEKIIRKSELLKNGELVDNHCFVMLKKDWHF